MDGNSDKTPIVLNPAQAEIRIRFPNNESVQVEVIGAVTPNRAFAASGMLQRLANDLIDMAQQQQMQIASIARDLQRKS